MGKRNANPAATKAAKKMKLDPALASIADSIMQAEDLPERCRIMLVDTMPLSLSIPAEKRHEVQHSVVDMVKQVLDAKKSTMEAAISVEEQQIQTLNNSRSEGVKSVEEAESALAAQKEVTQSAKTLLADATVAAKASSESLEGVRAKHKESTDKLSAAQQERTALETAFGTHFKPMVDGAAGEHLKELEPHLKHLQIEASLLIAVPSVCVKPKLERGSFDNVVLEELEKALSSKIAALGETVAAETPAVAEQETYMFAAQEELAAKKDTQKGAAADFEEVRKVETEKELVVKQAKAAVDGLQPDIDAASVRLEIAKQTLNTFEAGPLTQFSTYSKLSATETATETTTESAPLGA